MTKNVGLWILGTVLFSFSVCAQEFHYVQTATSDDFLVGELSFSSSAPVVNPSCVTQFDKYFGGESGCWYVSISYDGNEHTVFNGDEVVLDEFLKVEYDVSNANYIEGTVLDGWSNTFTFSFIKMPITYSVEGVNTLVLLNSDFKRSVNYVNEYTTFQGGFDVKIYSRLLNNNPVYFDNLAPFVFSKGVGVAEPMMPTGQLGGLDGILVPYFVVADTKIYSGPMTFFYNVVPNIDLATSTSTVCVSDSDCPEDFYCVDYGTVKLCGKNGGAKIITLPEQTNIGWYVLGILAFIILLFALRRKK